MLERLVCVCVVYGWMLVPPTIVQNSVDAKNQMRDVHHFPFDDADDDVQLLFQQQQCST